MKVMHFKWMLQIIKGTPFLLNLIYVIVDLMHYLNPNFHRKWSTLSPESAIAKNIKARKSYGKNATFNDNNE